MQTRVPIFVPIRHFIPMYLHEYSPSVYFHFYRSELRASGLQHLTSTPMCGVEGEATLLTSFHCLFFLKIGQLKLASLVEGDQSEFSFLSLKTNWYWVYKTSHYPRFFRRSAFPCLYEPKVFQLCRFQVSSAQPNLR